MMTSPSYDITNSLVISDWLIGGVVISESESEYQYQYEYEYEFERETETGTETGPEIIPSVPTLPPTTIILPSLSIHIASGLFYCLTIEC